jgi:hypothetical protein
MKKPRWRDPRILVERAVIAAVPNLRAKGWRNDQMKMFADRFGKFDPAMNDVQLEIECIRIIRAYGEKYARRLLNWFVKVKDCENCASYPLFVPRRRSVGSTKNLFD